MSEKRKKVNFDQNSDPLFVSEMKLNNIMLDIPGVNYAICFDEKYNNFIYQKVIPMKYLIPILKREFKSWPNMISDIFRASKHYIFARTGHVYYDWDSANNIGITFETYAPIFFDIDGFSDRQEKWKWDENEINRVFKLFRRAINHKDWKNFIDKVRTTIVKHPEIRSNFDLFKDKIHK